MSIACLEMERLTSVQNVLWQQLPLCTACQGNVADREVYCFLSCFHFVCIPCAGKNITTCSQCTDTALIHVSMEQLAQWQGKLREGLQGFYQGQNYDYFLMTCEAFYQLLQVVKAGQAVGSARQEPDYRNPSLPSLSAKGDWTCPKCHGGAVYPAGQRKCSVCPYVNLAAVETMLDTWTCSCGTTNPEFHTKCVACGKDKSAPEPMQVAPPHIVTSLWTCRNCTYEYNDVNQHAVCQKCGNPNPAREEQKVPARYDQRPQQPASLPAWQGQPAAFPAQPAWPVNPIPPQPGNVWGCACGFIHNAIGMACMHCGQAYVRPDLARPKTSNQPWTCALCKFNVNFRLDICSKCDQPRQEEEPPARPPAKPQPPFQPQQHIQAPIGQKQHPPNWEQMSKSQRRKWNKNNPK